MIDIDEITMRRWITCAYGAQEAEQAMRIPRKLREEFYREILRFGPAGVHIESMFAFAKRASSKRPFHDEQLLLLGDAYSQLDPEESGGNPSIHNWLQGFELESLAHAFRMKRPSLWKNADSKHTARGGKGLVFSALLLTADMSSPSHVRADLDPYFDNLHQAFEDLGVEGIPLRRYSL